VNTTSAIKELSLWLDYKGRRLSWTGEKWAVYKIRLKHKVLLIETEFEDEALEVLKEGVVSNELATS
jgi:hypothetical protein